MLIVPLDNEKLFCFKPDFKIDDIPIGICKVLLVASQEEYSKIVLTAKKLWQEISPPDFTGLIRADLVPAFRTAIPKRTIWRRMKAYDFGSLEIIGIYEFNVRSPECIAVGEALHQSMEILKEFQPNTCANFADAFKKTFGDSALYIVPGDSVLKRNFSKSLVRGLEREKIEVHLLNFEQTVEIMEKERDNEVFWIWADYGDFLPQDLQELPEWFSEILKTYQGEKKIFNTLYKKSLSNKGLLMPQPNKEWWNRLVGNNFFLDSKKAYSKAKKKKNFIVVKRLEGSSGRDIYFGRKESSNHWDKILKECLKKREYGVYEAKWLPRLKLPKFNTVITLDINPAFWCNGKGEVKDLYVIARADIYKNYFKRGTINVASGGGVIGNLIVDEKIK